MSFQREVFLPFHLVDAAGVLFFGHAFTLAHQILESYIVDELKIPWKTWFQNEEWIVPIIQAHASYDYPLLSGQTCFIQLQVKTIKTSSFQLDYHFFQHDIKCCSVSTVHVFCNRLTKEKIKIPSFIHLISTR